MLIQLENVHTCSNNRTLDPSRFGGTPRVIMPFKVFHGGRGSKGVEDEPVNDVITPLKSKCDFRGVVNLVICAELQPNDIMRDTRQLTNSALWD